MGTYHAGKVKMREHVVRPQARVEECQHKWLQDGQLHQCCAPTKGHTYCADCEYERSHAPCGSRYASFSGPAFGFSRRSGRAA